MTTTAPATAAAPVLTIGITTTAAAMKWAPSCEFKERTTLLTCFSFRKKKFAFSHQRWFYFIMILDHLSYENPSAQIIVVSPTWPWLSFWKIFRFSQIWNRQFNSVQFNSVFFHSASKISSYICFCLSFLSRISLNTAIYPKLIYISLECLCECECFKWIWDEQNSAIL